MTETSSTEKSGTGKSLSRRQFLGTTGALGASLATAALLAACGGSSAASPSASSAPASSAPASSVSASASAASPSSPAASASAAASTSASPSASAAATKVVVAQGTDPTTMDPDMQRETTTQNVQMHFYDPLLARDANNKYQAMLATSWKVVDNNTMEFKLRSGVKFSNGEPFNADVAKYNLDRVAGLLAGAKKTLNANSYASIAKVDAVDPTTLRIHTKHPDPLLLAYLTQKLMVPMKLTQDKGFDALATQAVGTGPYRLTQWVKNDHLNMQADPTYFRGAAKIQQVVFRPIPQAATSLAELKAGNVDLIVNVTPDNVPELKSNSKLDVKTVPSARVTMLWLNTTEKAMMKKKEVRQALNYAVDVDSIVKNVMDGYAVKMSTFVPKFFTGYDPKGKYYNYDPAKAKKMLAAAGYPNGFEMEILYPHGRYLNAGQVVQAIAGMYAKVGIKVKINAVEFGVFAKQTQQHKMNESMFAAWGNAPLDAWDTMNNVVRGGAIFSWYKNPQVDALIKKAGSTIDAQKHAQYLRQAERIIHDDAPFVFLYEQVDIYGTSKRLNWTPRPDEEIYMYDASV
ncbi:MAG: ABC transporter substrate-binding protein [Chloroflexota bacterium]